MRGLVDHANGLEIAWRVIERCVFVGVEWVIEERTTGFMAISEMLWDKYELGGPADVSSLALQHTFVLEHLSKLRHESLEDGAMGGIFAGSECRPAILTYACTIELPDRGDEQINGAFKQCIVPWVVALYVFTIRRQYEVGLEQELCSVSYVRCACDPNVQ